MPPLVGASNESAHQSRKDRLKEALRDHAAEVEPHLPGGDLCVHRISKRAAKAVNFSDRHLIFGPQIRKCKLRLRARGPSASILLLHKKLAVIDSP